MRPGLTEYNDVSPIAEFHPRLDRGSRILVVAAVREELADFRIRNGRVDLLLTGMGRRRALEAVRRSLARKVYRKLISAGFSGATQPGFRIGDLVLATEVIDESSGNRWIPAPGPAPANGSFAAGPSIPRPGSGQAPLRTGRFVTASRLRPLPDQKAHLGRLYEAVAVDLESSAVAQAAGEAGVPWMALRAILDPMEQILTVGSWLEAARHLLNPPRWKDLQRFREEIRQAGQALSQGLQEMSKSA